MPPRSKVRQLPQELRAELDRLLSDGRLGIREVTDHLRKLGADVSKSAVHRYSQDFERIAEDIRLSRQMAEALGRELEQVPGDAGRLAIESLQALLLRARMQLGSDADGIDLEDFGRLARACKDLESARKSNVDVEIRIRERTARDAADAAAQVATEQGLSEGTVEAIRARILGIAQRAA
jgi:hypothetical protein